MATATDPRRLVASLALALSVSMLGAMASAQTDRPFVYASDARTPQQLQTLATYRLTWGGAGNGALRPIGAAGLGAPGFMHEFGAEVGILDRLSARVYGVVSDTSSNGLGGNVSGTVGGELRGRLWSSADRRHHVTLSVGALRELTGSLALQLRAAGTFRFGGLTLTGDVTLERSTRNAADRVDVIVVAGASYAVRPWLRAGVEYVGQDLEALWDPDEIEGARQMAGPTVAFVSERYGLQIALGPAFGLTPQSPTAVLRAGVQYAFR